MSHTSVSLPGQEKLPFHCLLCHLLNDPAGVAAGSLIFSDTGSATLGEIDPVTGEPVGSFQNAASCTSGMATIDPVLVLFLLAVIVSRRRIGAFLMRVRTGAGLSARPGAAVAPVAQCIGLVHGARSGGG